MSTKRPCGYLAPLDTPQGVDPKGNKIWYCRCGGFTTMDANLLKIHVEGEGDPSFLLPMALLVVVLGVAYKYFQNWKTFLAGVIFVVIFAFFASVAYSKYHIWIKRKKDDVGLKKFRETPLPAPRKRYTAEHMKAINTLSDDYDPEEAPSVVEFKKIMKKSECTFAKSAHVWGNPAWKDELTLEQNVQRSLSRLLEGMNNGRELKLDGFVVMVPGNENSNTVEKFGETVRRVLTALSDHDPACDHQMDSDIIDKRGWRFTFNGVDIFVTSFAPCYPVDNARYAWGVNDACFVLLQPQYSFDFHDIGDDHPWDDTQKTARQKIRQNFKDAGRIYYVPQARYYPAAPMIVPPLKVGGERYEWFRKPPGVRSNVFHP